MRNSSGGSRRQKWLTAYRLVTVFLLVVIVAMGGTLLSRSFLPITVSQVSKVEQATSFIQSVGFNDPTYLGVQQEIEGEYPTFQATAIGGKSINLFVRTTPNGGWELQPVGMFKSVASADDFARVAQKAVYDWEHIPADIKPRTDGTYGEYESRKSNYDLLSKYNPDPSYWTTPRYEINGWPRK